MIPRLTMAAQAFQFTRVAVGVGRRGGWGQGGARV